MDEMKQKEPVYSNERAETTAMDCPAAPAKTAGPSDPASSAQASKKTPTAFLLEIARSTGFSSPADYWKFLRRTKRVWLRGSAVIIGLVVMVTLVKDLTRWFKTARERRQEQAVATVTPDRLIARCGPPAEDQTKEVYPILMRTMTYQPRASEKLVVAFSRTAEDHSDWVFLSMKDDVQPTTFDTPQAKIAALPCLYSKK